MINKGMLYKILKYLTIELVLGVDGRKRELSELVVEELVVKANVGAQPQLM